MPARSPAAIEHKREYQRKYYSDPAVRERLRGYQREYERERRAAGGTAFVEYKREYDRAHHQRLKIDALAAYGGPQCVRCGDTTIDRLTLDHVNGDGAEHRWQLCGDPNQGGIPFYYKLRDLDWPNDPPLQVLCGPCNQNKRTEDRALVRTSASA